MEINHKSTILENSTEKLLSNFFKTTSLADFVKSELLVVSFQGFLERGTIEDCWELVPDTHKAALSSVPHSNGVVSSQGTNTSPEAPTSYATLLPKSPRAFQASARETLIPPVCKSQLRPPPLLSPSSTSPWARLVAQTKCDDPKRIQRLVQVIEALESAVSLPPESYQKLWSAREGLFAGNETGLEGWTSRLARGCTKIDKGTLEYNCASRLSFMLIPHYVDYAEKWGGLKLGRTGNCRRSAAMDMAARAFDVSLKTLRYYIAKTRNYFYLLQKVGPGHVLELGSGVSTLWEKNLTYQDIDEIQTYVKNNLPAVHARANSLNGIGARTFRAGLVECGWTEEALLKSTRLIDSVMKYQHELDPPCGNNRLSSKKDPDHSCDDLTSRSPKRRRVSPPDNSANEDTNSLSREGEISSPNFPRPQVLEMAYSWNPTFDVPPTPDPTCRGSWATDVTSLECPGPSMLDFSFDWDNNFASQ